MATDSNSTSLNPLIGHCYSLKLSQSILSLLSQLGSENADSIQLADSFYELVQARVDPPLESIWVYVSLAFRSRNDPKKDDPLDRISSAEHLLQLIQSCSSSCGSSKSVALLAPVVYEVHNVVAELFGKKENLSSERERKAMKEVRSLVESILGYVNLCSSKGFVDEGESGLVSPFSDLVHIWAGPSVAVESFLPLVSGEVCGRVCEEGCEVGYLASIVVFEAFLLKLCLSFRIGISKEDLVKELRTWAVGSITGFGNFYFFETLVRMLLEKTLSLSLLSSSEDEVLLKKVLYDAVILVDYSFLNPERTIHLPADRVRNLAIARLLVTHEAVVYFREHGDQRKSVAYMNAFSNSCLSSHIIRWIKNQIHADEIESKARGSSPIALIKWLVNLQNQGIQVIDDSILKSRAELFRDTSNTDSRQPSSKSEAAKVDDDLLFFVDNKGEELDAEDEDDDEKSNEAVTAAFVAAARSMKSVDDGGKKRKVGKSSEKKRKTKSIRYEPLHNSEVPIERSLGIGHKSESSGSEAENPVSGGDDDSDQNEQ